MALTSFILVLGDGAPRPRRQAAILYLVMTHVATVFVVASFFIVAKESGSTDFAAMARCDAVRFRWRRWRFSSPSSGSAPRPA